MAFVAKFITKRIFKERLANHFGQEDPYFEQVPATRLDGTPSSKMKKRRKALPPGITVHDGRILTKVKRRAWRLDMSLFSLCGVRFGWGSAIGLVPAVGDVVDALLALMVFRTCCKVEDGLPAGVKMQMMFNIIVDFAVGLIPFAGDVVDAMFRCNTKNAVLLEEHLRQKGRKALRQEGKPIPNVDPSDPDYHEDFESAADPVTEQPRRNKNNAGRNAATREGRAGHMNGIPGNEARDTVQPPVATEPRPSGGIRSWLFSRNPAPNVDPEMGRPVAPAPAQVTGTRRRDERR